MNHIALRLARASVLCAAALAARGSHAFQPEPPRDVVAIDPAMVINDARTAYSQAPTADEIVVILRQREGAESRDRFTFRFDPGSVEPPRPRRMLLEMGALRAFFADGRFVAIHTGDPTTYAEEAFDGPVTPAVVARLLPPVPLPQLALAFGEGDLTPYSRAIQWDSATLDERARTATANGTCSSGAVAMTVDAAGRILRFRAEIAPPAGPEEPSVLLELRCEAIDPGEPAKWEPTIEGRQRVDRIAMLRTAAGSRPPEVKPGLPAPDVHLLSVDLNPWTLYDALPSLVTMEPGTPLRWAVLLLFRADGSDGREQAAQAGLAAIRELRYGVDGAGTPLAGNAPPAFVDRAGAVMELGAFERARFEAMRARWRAAAAGGRALDSDDLMWAPAAAQSIDRLSRTHGAAIAVVSPDRVLRAVIGLDGRAGDAAGIVAELRAAMTPPPAEAPK